MHRPTPWPAIVLLLAAAACASPEPGAVGEPAPATSNGGEPSYSESVELSAMKVREQDRDLDEAWLRVADKESQPVDDQTWDAMHALANDALGGVPESIEASRRWISVKARSGPLLIDVLWHGQAIHIYCTSGITSDDRLYEMLNRLRAKGFTIAQGARDSIGWEEVPPSRTFAEMVAVERAATGG